MIPERYAPVVYSLFRAVVGFLFVCHGLQKFGFLGGLDGNGGAAPLASRFGVAAIIETVCGTLVLLGLFTKPIRWQRSRAVSTGGVGRPFASPAPGWFKLPRGLPARARAPLRARCRG